MIVVGKYYLLVEAKFLSTFQERDEEGQSQLLREARGGALEARSLGKEFYLIALTADYLCEPEKFHQIHSQLPSLNFKWTNWQQVCSCLLDTAEKESLPSTTRLFCQDLCDLLDRKNLRSFRDLKSVLGGKPRLEHAPKVFFESETATLRGDFIGFLTTLSYSARLGELPKTIFFQSRSFFTGLSSGAGLKALNGRIFLNREA